MVGAEAVRRAKAEVERIERETRAAVLIETVESVGEQPVRAAAAIRAERWGREGIYVLIVKSDHRFEVTPTPGFRKFINIEDSQAIRDAFLSQFKRGQYDEGLLAGIHVIGVHLIAAA